MDPHALPRVLRLTRHLHASPNRQTSSEPPVIDIAALTAPHSEQAIAEVVSQIAAAAREWGFFQVLNHGVPEEVVDAFDKASKGFFSMDKEEYKYKIKRTQENSRGYFDDELTKQTLDWKECVDIGAQDGNIDGISDIDGWNQWPEDQIKTGELPEHTHERIAFKESMTAYFHAATALSRTLLGALALGMGEQQDYFDRLFNGHTSYLRLNHYPPCETPFSETTAGEVFYSEPLMSPDPKKGQGYLSINRHTDAGILTVLRQKHDEPHSLQVFVPESTQEKELAQVGDHENRKGKWISVSPVPHAFTINIGDMMQVYANDQYVAPLHRVLAHPERDRYSAPFFFNPPYKEDVQPLSEMGEARYNFVNWGDFRRRRFEGDYADVGKEVQISQYRI